MTELPKRRASFLKPIVRKDYSYSFIAKNDIDLETINAIIISAEDLSCDMSYLIEICNKSSFIQLKFKDFESALFIDSILKSKINNKSFLLDDALRLDRSYVDLTKLKNIRLFIPLNYLMWGVKFNESVDTYCFLIWNSIQGYINPTSINGNEKISYEDFVKINQKVEELSKLGGCLAEEKVALVSDFIQSRTQYIDGYQTNCRLGHFVTPDFPNYDEYRNYSGLIETVLNKNNGVCMGIANLSTVLLNNPIMGVEVESVYGSSHVWNKVLIGGKYYYFDNTWSITQNENMCEDGLVALSFTKKFLFFGQKTATSIGSHNPSSLFIYDGVICEDDLEMQSYNSIFTYQDKPIYRSRKKPF